MPGNKDHHTIDCAEKRTDRIALDKTLASVSLTLCHIQELIGLAYQLSCELHPTDNADAILRTSGRLATLMHVSAQQLSAAQAETKTLAEAHRPR